MPTYGGKVRADGSVVIPQELRERLGIEPESDVEWFLTWSGQIHFHHITDRFSEFGHRVPVPPISIREMDDAIADEVDDRNRRSLPPRSQRPAAE